MNNYETLMDAVSPARMEGNNHKIRGFSFSLKDKALAWYQTIPYGRINTWEEMVSEFLTKFFPPYKTTELRGKINAFMMKD